MIVNPEKVVFENTTDIVDYVSKGLPPTRKNFEKVMLKVRHPDSTKDEAGSIYISNNLFINCDNDTLNEALCRVYANRIRNRNITIGLIGTIALGLIIGGSVNNHKHKDEPEVEDSIDM